MRFRQRLCEYALKHGVTMAARNDHILHGKMEKWKEAIEKTEKSYITERYSQVKKN